MRFLALTGWRRGEMLGIKWNEVDLARRTARLSDTKTGKSLRPLSHAACDILRELPRLGEFVFPGCHDANKPMANFSPTWVKIAKTANLPADVIPHVLRHSFASVAVDLGFSEPSPRCSATERRASPRNTRIMPTPCCFKRPMPSPIIFRNSWGIRRQLKSSNFTRGDNERDYNNRLRRS
jgi:integrase